MDPPDQVVNSGGGAVFQGDVTAGRDITINHITEIRQVTERLSNRLTSTDTPEKLLGSLEALSGAAEFTEDYAKELKAGVFASGFPLELVCRECASILSELKRLESLLGRDVDGDDVTTASLNENVLDIRSRLMSLQMHLSSIISRKTAKDFEDIRKKVTQLMNSQSGSDEASSIRTFYTASVIPYVERQRWQEIQNAMCAHFSTEYVRDNYALIVASVEEYVFDNTSSWIAHGPKPDGLPSESLKAGTADTYLRLSEKFNVAMSNINGANSADGASIRTLVPQMSKIALELTGTRWSRAVEDGSGECLLTLDGGGVKSYSSILIIEAIMKEVIACENRFEQEFTHYPRTFNASDFRPCHYFHKMYGTSTGGILAIALGRLRMTVAETIAAFVSILNAMYGSTQRVASYHANYNHWNFDAALLSMAQQYCKQHERGTCNHKDNFGWPLTGIIIDRDDDKVVDPEELSDSGGPDLCDKDVNTRQQERHRSERRAPEYHVCQTICVAALHTGQMTDKACMLRTYNHIYDLDIAPPWITPYNQDTTDFTISQVGRATMAATSYIKNGVILENNPSYCAYSEACSLWGDELEPSLLLSIGTGLTSSDTDDRSFSRVIPFGLPGLKRYAKRLAVFKNVLIKYAEEGQDPHRTMRVIAKGSHKWYKRFEVTHGLEKIRRDEWVRETPFLVHNLQPMYHVGGKTINTIRTATEAYISRPDPDVGLGEYVAPGLMLQQTAERLVRMRRARELEAMTQGGKKREQWEAFMGKHLPGEREFFRKYREQWDYALLGRKQ